MYVTAEYYYNEYGGGIPAEELTKYLKIASDKIDAAAFGRIGAAGFGRLTAFQQAKIKDAVCYQADYVYAHGIDAENVQSYSVLDLSVSVDRQSEAGYAGLSGMALEHLNQTGLTGRGL